MGNKSGIFCAVLLVVLGSLTAYSQPSQRQVYIPFDFMVGRHMLQAGQYRVRLLGADVRIEALRGIAAVTVPADTVEDELRERALSAVTNYTEGKTVRKVVVAKGPLVSVVVS